jgi:hypothetical protein
MAKTTREIEFYRLWAGNGGASGTWDTDFVDIPADTPDELIAAAVQRAADQIAWNPTPPVAVGVYSVPPLEDAVEPAAEALIRRYGIETRLTDDQQEALDDAVHDVASYIASDINNSSIETQVAYLITYLGEDEADRRLGDILREVPDEN